MEWVLDMVLERRWPEIDQWSIYNSACKKLIVIQVKSPSWRNRYALTWIFLSISPDQDYYCNPYYTTDSSSINCVLGWHEAMSVWFSSLHFASMNFWHMLSLLFITTVRAVSAVPQTQASVEPKNSARHKHPWFPNISYNSQNAHRIMNLIQAGCEHKRPIEQTTQAHIGWSVLRGYWGVVGGSQHTWSLTWPCLLYRVGFIRTFSDLPLSYIIKLRTLWSQKTKSA